MNLDLVGLAVLMGAVTYPSRAIPLLTPGHRAPAAARAPVPAPGRSRGAGVAGRRGHAGASARTTARATAVRRRGGRRPAVPRDRASGGGTCCWASWSASGSSRSRARSASGRPARRPGGQPLRASASISTRRLGVISRATTTSVAAGRMSRNSSPWTAVTASASAGIHDEHAGPDDVGEREAGLVERALDDREHGARLGRRRRRDGARRRPGPRRSCR